MAKVYRGVVWGTLALWLTSVPAVAQVSLRSQMSRLFETSLVLARTPAGVGVVSHTPTFAEDPVLRETTDLVNQISAQIGLQFATVPLESSAGGFTDGFDSTLGTFNRTTETFGPAYAERAATVGEGYAVGVTYVHRSYTALDGLDLANGDIRFNLFHQRLTPASYVEGDVIQVGVRMRLTSDTTVFQGRYGLTDNLDVGLSLPLVRVRMDLVYRATILDFATRSVSPYTLTTGMGALGAKINVWRNALVSANLLVPIAHAGLRSRASFVAGSDYTF